MKVKAVAGDVQIMVDGTAIGCAFYKIEGFDGCYCSDCVNKIRKEMDG